MCIFSNVVKVTQATDFDPVVDLRAVWHSISILDALRGEHSLAGRAGIFWNLGPRRVGWRSSGLGWLNPIIHGETWLFLLVAWPGTFFFSPAPNIPSKMGFSTTNQFLHLDGEWMTRCGFGLSSAAKFGAAFLNAYSSYWNCQTDINCHMMGLPSPATNLAVDCCPDLYPVTNPFLLLITPPPNNKTY